jgi:hypothetical protein
LFVLPVDTELQLKSVFTQPGIWFKVILRAENLHNPEASAVMEW